MWLLDFPGGPVVKNTSANAGDMVLIPDPGRFHMPKGNENHVPQLLSPRSRAHTLRQENPLQWESLCTTTREEPPFPATIESWYAATKIQHGQNKYNI